MQRYLFEDLMLPDIEMSYKKKSLKKVEIFAELN